MSKASVLIIDDNLAVLEMLELALGKAGFKVLTATDGNSGVSTFREQTPDLVIVDIAMPGMDGYQVIEQIREGIDEEKRVPIIILTAHSQSVMQAYADELGADLYLTKPVLPRVLLDHIINLLNL